MEAQTTVEAVEEHRPAFDIITGDPQKKLKERWRGVDVYVRVYVASLTVGIFKKN